MRRRASTPIASLALAASLLFGCAGARPGAAGLDDPYFPLLGNGGYDVQHYDLDLSIDPDGWTLDGVATLDVVARHALSRFQLELHGLHVEDVTVDGEPAAHTREGDELVITPASAIPRDARFAVRIAYGGVPRAVPSAAVPFLPGVGWMTSDDSLYVMSEPNGASSFFPCNDHPTDKATYAFALTVPEPLVAVANGVPVSVTPTDDGRRTFRFESGDLMASYLATLAVGPFELSEETGPDGMPLRAWVHPAVSAEQRANLAHIPAMLELFTGQFGPYPFETFGTIASNLPFGAALETQGVPTYGTGALTQSTLAHELAHQWFGNSVSMRRFADIWLTEGFAGYASWLWTEHTEGRASLDVRARRSYERLRRDNIGPPIDPGVARMFGAEVYGRGAFAVHALRLAVGDETFFEILRTYTTRFRDQSVDVSDFVSVVAELGGADAADVMNAWLYERDVPVIASLETAPAEAGAPSP